MTQLRRTVGGWRALVFLVAIAVLASGGGAGFTAADIASISIGSTPDNKQASGGAGTTDEAPSSSRTTPSTTAEPGTSRQTATAGTTKGATASPRDVVAVQRWFVQFINEMRQERGLPTVETSSVLREMGTTHSEAMAALGYIGHDLPTTGSIRERFQEQGLLPECRIDIEGSRRYYAGAENAAQTWVNRRVLADWAGGGSYTVTTARDLAYALFQMWMHSPGHRKPMVQPDLGRVGLGLVVTESGEVYAALEMCGGG